MIIGRCATMADSATSRLPALPDPAGDPALRELLDGIRARGSLPLNLHLVVAHSPKIAAAFIAMAHALRFDAVLPRRFRELAILRVAQLTGSRYEFAQHRSMGLECGISGAQIDGLGHWRASKQYDDRERAVLAYVECVASGGDVDKMTFAEVAKCFDSREIVELTLTTSFYFATALLLKSLEVKLEGEGG